MTNTIHNTTLPTDAGHDIAAQVFISDQPHIKGVCIIAPATGVAQRLYNDFAFWLNLQGYHVISFDYDGIGQSINGHVKHSKSDKLSWAKYDCAAVINYAKEQFPDLKITWIGHSVGGHMLGMMDSTEHIDKAITVAAGTGTWWHNAPPTKRIVWFLWYVLAPTLVPIMGYFPGNKLGLLCDLPKGVIMQWRRWCLKEGYAVEYEGDWLKQRFASVKTPITAVTFSDDDMMSLTNIDALHSFFTGSHIERVHVTPQQINKKRIGHIGWHKQSFHELWETAFKPIL